ncbi:TPA: HlyD family efflux transporter periplasmic adaptor subunit [Legionella pneumophila]|uniref:HlyD family secretion protein n=1 Tax=Legionella pneumophila TaxID=446 RepID=UPI001374D42C|nr:HlyD family secretion protein [Legionella pneumophila]HAT8751912.1 HlyD family efflux transporter periplasmic adaptor subunit [Legionella pneumophila]HAU1644906.1 HlyD family secretion protein [Legionella pneumophila]
MKEKFATWYKIVTKHIRFFFSYSIPIFFKKAKNYINLPIIVVGLALIIGLFHLFSYLLPFTDNAFVVTNVTPVAADVSGFITEIYVKNGQKVKKNDPIFSVYRVPYELAYQQAMADYKEGLKKIDVFQKQIERTVALIKATDAELEKAQFALGLKKNKNVAEAVSVLELKNLGYDVSTLSNKRNALQQEVAVLQAKIEQQRHTVASLKAKMDNAKVNLDLTIVRAPGDGVIDNMYVSPNTPIEIHKPVFSFIDTANYYIQANFNETDLRNVRQGDKAYIILRMYYFDKIFHGVVVNSLWAAERQSTAPKSQIQVVTNQNEWLLLPQRFPLQIKILDPDPDYPLNPGASAYVYISTKR